MGGFFDFAIGHLRVEKEHRGEGARLAGRAQANVLVGSGVGLFAGEGQGVEWQ